MFYQWFLKYYLYIQFTTILIVLSNMRHINILVSCLTKPKQLTILCIHQIKHDIMKNYFKFYSLLIISLILIGCNNTEQPNVFGYESEDGNKVDILREIKHRLM